ncbi:MAG TPA: NAD-dependent epimerase/dehydratase family protein [Gaiellaceae bacterium]|nr:NAD-dependent epimerase/dehydratase family protein [Gaiellaceae bacterium]
MRIFLAGASGVIGSRLVPLLVAAGHDVAGMTRSSSLVKPLGDLGAEPLVCDVFDLAALTDAVVAFRPDAVVHELTDLPDSLNDLPEYSARNDRMRSEGTRNLVAAATAAGATHFLAQSIAWTPSRGGEVVEAHEQMVLGIGGVVVRYGQLYGSGTFYESEVPPEPRLQVDDAARRTVPLLTAPSGIVTLVDAASD